jgi:hypothetical protein
MDVDISLPFQDILGLEGAAARLQDFPYPSFGDFLDGLVVDSEMHLDAPDC